jgi:hypothetical protein
MVIANVLDKQLRGLKSYCPLESWLDDITLFLNAQKT